MAQKMSSLLSDVTEIVIVKNHTCPCDCKQQEQIWLQANMWADQKTSRHLEPVNHLECLYLLFEGGAVTDEPTIIY